MLLPGVAAPDITLPDLDGVRWNLREALRDGPVVLAFFKISCPTCQMTFPFLQRLVDGVRPGGPQLIAISQDGLGDTHEFRQRLGVSMPNLLDAGPAYNASNAYEIESVPSIFVVETDGTIAMAFTGFHKVAIEDLAARFEVAPFRENDHVPALQPG